MPHARHKTRTITPYHWALIFTICIMFYAPRAFEKSYESSQNAMQANAAVDVSHCPSPGNIAIQLIQHWKEKTSRSWTDIRNSQTTTPDFSTSSSTGGGIATRTAEIINEAGLTVDSDLCYSKFVWDSAIKKVVQLDDFSLHCNSSSLTSLMTERGQFYANFMTYIASTMLESATWKSFAFYMDLTDGTRKNPALRKSFGFPLLAQGASPTDDQAFLVPDTHMMAGVLWGSTYESTIPESLAGFAQHLHDHYLPEKFAITWDSKAPAAIYRANCHPTIDPDNPHPHTRIFLRSDLCAAYSHKPTIHLDIGVFTHGGGAAICSSVENMAKYRFCQLCKQCSTRPELTPEEMMQYKYQVGVDGHGPAFDATVWKLLSNSAVLLVHPDDRQQLVWDNFYFPLLQSGKHYFTTSIKDLEDQVEWCRKHDDECRQVAANARTAVACVVRPGVIAEYFAKLLTLLHDWQYPSSS